MTKQIGSKKTTDSILVRQLYYFISKSNDWKVYFLLFLAVGVLLSCEKEDKQNLGSGYYLVTDVDKPGYSKIIHGTNEIFDDVILGEIIDFDLDADYIVIHRSVTEKARLLFDESPLWKKQLRDIDQYWIIEKKYDGIHGPLNLTEYLQKRKELGISSGVKIRK